MEYTKGEWTAKQNHIGDWQVVSIFPPFPIPICEMCWTNLPPHNQAKANANLIASAPDLYEACATFMRDGRSMYDPAYQAILKAMYKAEGKDEDY